MLTEQSYEYIAIHSKSEFIANLRSKLEQLNDYVFSDSEWNWLFQEYIANANDGIFEKTRTIQEGAVKNLTKDDGSTKNKG